MVKTVYIIRHGFRASWSPKYVSTITGTYNDSPLSAHGVDQAHELARYFKEEGIQIDPLNLPIYVEPGVGEFFMPVPPGSKLVHPRPLPARELKRFIPSISTTHDTVLLPPQRGETIQELHSRASQFFDLLLPICENVDTILISSHAATVIALSRALTGDPSAEVRAGCASLGQYEFEEGRWKMVRNGDCSHLRLGEERHWDFEMVEEHFEDGVVEADERQYQGAKM